MKAFLVTLTVTIIIGLSFAIFSSFLERELGKEQLHWCVDGFCDIYSGSDQAN